MYKLCKLKDLISAPIYPNMLVNTSLPWLDHVFFNALTDTSLYQQISLFRELFRGTSRKFKVCLKGEVV